MNNSYITIIKEKRTDWSRKHVPLNQNECTADFRIGVPFKQNLHEFKLPSDISNCFYIQLYLSDGDNVLSENNYRLLVGDQKAAQEAAYGMYKIMHQKSREYGKGYYRYFPDMFSDL